MYIISPALDVLKPLRGLVQLAGDFCPPIFWCPRKESIPLPLGEMASPRFSALSERREKPAVGRSSLVVLLSRPTGMMLFEELSYILGMLEVLVMKKILFKGVLLLHKGMKGFVPLCVLIVFFQDMAALTVLPQKKLKCSLVTEKRLTIYALRASW